MSAPRIDFEVMVTQIVNMMKNNLNTKIDAINTEKNDTISCQHVSTTLGYAVLSLDDLNMNADPFMAILVEDIVSKGMGPATINEITMALILVKQNAGDDPNIYKRMLRYLRAISEVVEDHFSDVLSGNIFSIKNLAPARLVALNTTNNYMGTGVEITFPMSS